MVSDLVWHWNVSEEVFVSSAVSFLFSPDISSLRSKIAEAASCISLDLSDIWTFDPSNLALRVSILNESSDLTTSSLLSCSFC